MCVLASGSRVGVNTANNLRTLFPYEKLSGCGLTSSPRVLFSALLVYQPASIPIQCSGIIHYRRGGEGGCTLVLTKQPHTKLHQCHWSSRWKSRGLCNAEAQLMILLGQRPPLMKSEVEAKVSPVAHCTMTGRRRQ